MALGAALLLAGCAAESPPKPPRVQKPEAIRDLAVTQVGSKVRISFTPPSVATDGEGITKPLEIEILRALNTPEQTKGSTALPVLSTWISLTPADVAYPEVQKVTEEKQLNSDEFRRAVRGRDSRLAALQC